MTDTPRSPQPTSWTDLADSYDPRPVLESQRRFEGHIWDVVTEKVNLGEGGVVERDLIRHPGAVGVLPMDEQGRVLLLRQYRHPVSSFLWEPPAGLRDVEGEPPLLTAQRELAEEAGLRAGSWHVLVDYFNSPGGTDEAFRCYLARGLEEIPAEERHEPEGEEIGMQQQWVPLPTAVQLVLAGRLHNPHAVTSILAASAAAGTGWSSLRPGDADWPEGQRRVQRGA